MLTGRWCVWSHPDPNTQPPQPCTRVLPRMRQQHLNGALASCSHARLVVVVMMFVGIAATCLSLSVTCTHNVWDCRRSRDLLMSPDPCVTMSQPFSVSKSLSTQ